MTRPRPGSRPVPAVTAVGHVHGARPPLFVGDRVGSVTRVTGRASTVDHPGHRRTRPPGTAHTPRDHRTGFCRGFTAFSALRLRNRPPGRTRMHPQCHSHQPASLRHAGHTARGHGRGRVGAGGRPPNLRWGASDVCRWLASRPPACTRIARPGHRGGRTSTSGLPAERPDVTAAGGCRRCPNLTVPAPRRGAPPSGRWAGPQSPTRSPRSPAILRSCAAPVRRGPPLSGNGQAAVLPRNTVGCTDPAARMVMRPQQSPAATRPRTPWPEDPGWLRRRTIAPAPSCRKGAVIPCAARHQPCGFPGSLRGHL